MAGYSNKKFSLGIEYNYQTDNKLKTDRIFSVIQLMAPNGLVKNLDLFARYDDLNSVKLVLQQIHGIIQKTDNYLW